MPEEKLGLQQAMGKILAMPKDVVLHLPRIILLGNLQCCVEMGFYSIRPIWLACRPANTDFILKDRNW